MALTITVHLNTTDEQELEWEERRAGYVVAVDQRSAGALIALLTAFYLDGSLTRRTDDAAMAERIFACLSPETQAFLSKGLEGYLTY